MIDGIKSKFTWLFSLHYKIERFGVMLVSLLLAMAVLCASALHYNAVQRQITLGSQVMYSTDVEFSMSGNAGKVQNVYLSSDHTQAFVLLKWDNMSKLVTDVDEYEVFLCGSDLNGNYEKIQSHPSIGIYVFGATGYMGFYLVDGAGFPEQILNMTVRCNRMLGSPRADMPVYADASFNKYDQVKIFFNPGGSDFEPASFLDERRMQIYDVIDATIVDGQEGAIRAVLDDDLVRMQTLLNQIDEYKSRLERQGIIVPDAPPQIRGDRIVADANGDLELATSYMLPGALDYDWRHGSVLEGYLDGIVPENMTPTRFLTAQANAAKNESFTTANLRWLNADGSELDTSNPHNLQTIADINTNKQALMGAWTDYFNLKTQYQTDHLAQLLTLEMLVNDLTTNYGIKTSLTTTIY